MRLALVTRNHLRIAELVGPNVGPQHKACFLVLGRLSALGIRPSLGLKLPLGSFDRGLDGRTAFFGITVMRDQLIGPNLMIAPRLGQHRQRFFGLGGGLTTLRLQRKEVFGDGLHFTLTRFVDTRLGALKGGLRPDHQPPLGHAIVAQHHWLIARRLIKAMPRIPPERLCDDRRDQLERAGNTRDQAEFLEIGGMLFGVQFGVGHEGARAGRSLQGRDQRLGSLLENLRVRGMTIPTFAQQRHPAVLGDHEL